MTREGAAAGSAAAVTAWIGLGANLGDATATLRSACTEIAQIPQVSLDGVSRLWRSAPVGATGPDYLNAVARVRTTLAAPTLLAQLLAIEQRHGRQRPSPNAPRTLDLDLLLYGDDVIEVEGLTVPHPRMHLRAFVLAPMAEVDPSVRIPCHGAIGPLLAAIDDQPLEPVGPLQ